MIRDATPDVALTLPADGRAAFRARGEIHRVLRDVHPQRRSAGARLVGLLLDSATGVPAQAPIELRLWRSPGLLVVQLHSASGLRMADDGRPLLERLADRWDIEDEGRTVRFEVRTDLSRSPSV